LEEKTLEQRIEELEKKINALAMQIQGHNLTIKLLVAMVFVLSIFISVIVARYFKIVNSIELLNRILINHI
jgi:hypothetical protein